MINLSKISNWKPSKNVIEIKTIDAHTEGEPLRVVIKGFPSLKGNTILEKRNHIIKNYDHIRRAIMLEPRGHADMYGAIITEPEKKSSDFGVIFMHNDGYSTGCGHAVIAISKILAETGAIKITEPETEINMDVPSGTIKAFVKIKNEIAYSIRFINVPSFVEKMDAKILIPKLGNINYDLAFGGAYYAIVNADEVGLDRQRLETSNVIDLGMKIKNAIAKEVKIKHPNIVEMNFLYGTIFTFSAINKNNHSKNICVFANGEVDRSPTGTGVSARAAVHFAKNEIKLNETIKIESIIGSTFEVKVIEKIKIGPLNGVIPEVKGTANITGKNTFWIDSSDNIGEGFMLR